jgi:uncharacterized protein (DUF305 family)
MNPKFRLLAPIAIVLGTLGLGSWGLANLTIKSNPQLTLAQKSDGTNHGGMNHDGMNHDSMKKGGMMDHNMDVGPADANYDLRFLDSMIPHHQGALVMSKEVLAKSKRPELIKLAKGILADQQKDIAQMKLWRKQWYPKASITPIMWHAEMNHEMAMTPKHKESMMMSMSLGQADPGFDLRFLDAMIPHHQGAVTMGKDLLVKSKRPEMKKFAQNIIKSQQAEIDLMTKWQKEWAGK